MSKLTFSKYREVFIDGQKILKLKGTETFRQASKYKFIHWKNGKKILYDFKCHPPTYKEKEPRRESHR